MTGDGVLTAHRVFALGPDAVDAAREYAGATGRELRAVSSSEEIDRATSSDVVVCLSNQVTPRLMQRLYVAADDGPAAAPGIVMARDRDELAQVCRKLAARVAAPERADAPRVLINTEELTGAVRHDGDVRVGGSTPHAEIVELLRSDAAVLTLTGHSDGIDMAVSLRAFLCPFTAAPAVPSSEEGLPPCRIVGRCTRFPTTPTAQEAHAAGWVIPVSDVRARVAIFFSCSVVKTQDAVVDPTHGLAASMLRDADIAALVSTWREERDTADGAILNDILNDLSHGLTVGEATARFNASPVGRRVGASFCVIGDPSVRLSGAQRFADLPSPQFTSIPDVPETSRRGDLRLLLDVSRETLRMGQPGEDTDAGTSLEAWLAQHVDDGGEAPPELDDALARFLGGNFRLEELFGTHGIPGATDEHATCPVCAGPAREYPIAFPAHGARPRRVIRCACCLESENMPEDWHPALDLSRIGEGIVGLRGTPENARARVTLLGYYGSNEGAADWPREADGRLAETMRLPELRDTNPAYCKIFVAQGLRFGSFGLKVKRRVAGGLTSSAFMRADAPLTAAR
jgi:hypothetical protein